MTASPNPTGRDLAARLVTKRVYLAPDPDDGHRVLVDRLWPRGLSKEKARIDDWVAELAPSHDLRRWFGHDPQRWPEFKRRYWAELAAREEALAAFVARLPPGRITLLYGARTEAVNNAQALREYLGGGSGGD